MSELVLEVTDKNFKTEVLESNSLVLVDFWAEWCGPCRALAPTVERVAEKHSDTIKVCKINIEENPEITTQFNIRQIPFLAFIKNGQKVAELIGNQPEDAILKQIAQLK
ncbi:thioredoxin [Spirobacillus cienkowskii]|jgi:thioredoxin 1|uniref:Thioredoxin n=1 Tax=Spirobacillus cienkowskii TaxID=495820 RepID=A0A369KNP8_9BACT|nr:MAG: thioredoxin [Spirobacillus cienkowskii]